MEDEPREGTRRFFEKAFHACIHASKMRLVAVNDLFNITILPTTDIR